MRYLPHTTEEIESMLETVGLSSLDDLFSSIPEAVRPPQPLKFDRALDETTLRRHLLELADKNRGSQLLSFLGAGAYDHYSPQAMDQLLLRSELYTAYTPYQAEVSQGTLQIIFEFQTIVSEILGLPVANASMYDASTAAAEAVLMARRLTKRNRMVLSACLHPHYAETISTYTREIDHDDPQNHTVACNERSASDVDALIAAIDEDTACVIVGYPSFLGTITDFRAVADAAHAKGALFITTTAEPYALGVLAPPGDLGADIAVAEGQALGLAPQYGGPGVGLFACRDDRKFLQQIPGRLCGETVDSNGKRGYVLTLATREQHIRRERATSNICTNSGLCATAVTIAMCMLGKHGFIEIAEQCLSKTEYLKQALANLDGYTLVSEQVTFNEFAVAVRGGDAAALIATLADQGILAGLDLGRFDATRAGQLLVAVTEKHRREDLDRFSQALSNFVG